MSASLPPSRAGPAGAALQLPSPIEAHRREDAERWRVPVTRCSANGGKREGCDSCAMVRL
jgi:hypothetical protein